MNAHCDQSPVVICNEKLYQFRIFELSEPFCGRRNGNNAMSQSCDNVTQKLKQAERNKRISDTFTYYPQIKESNSRREMCSRSQSLPINLSDCGRDTFSREDSKDHLTANHHHDKHARDSSLRRKINGFSKESIENEIYAGKYNLKDIRKEQRTKEDEDKLEFYKDCSRTDLKKSDQGTRRNVVIADVITEDLHCIQIKSNLRDLSSRYDKKHLENKSKPELISIIMELQDALSLATQE